MGESGCGGGRGGGGGLPDAAFPTFCVEVISEFVGGFRRIAGDGCVLL